jgi:restriction system protein
MTIWLVRAGRHGQYEDFVIEQNQVAIGWDRLSDVSAVRSRENLAELYKETYPDQKPMAVANQVGQLWAFLRRIESGDLVALPLKKRSVIAFGRVQGQYQYKPDNPEGARHTRSVNWISMDVPRSAFDQDILYSLGAAMTVCRITRNNAEERIKAVLERKPLPPVPEDGEPQPDLEENARNQIQDYIGEKFKGHELARLIDEILKAQGYKTLFSTPGPDGGVDIIAGKGAMGFDPPKLCVQVKSGSSSADVNILRALQGVMKSFRADQGLLVSWGGFKSSVVKEARQHFFEVRLWDSGDIISALFENYDKLPEEVKAELPLKRIWALVPAEEV